tara:strand:- start:2042 stop:3076 length:1035 start_codon:yes stop_codon:yes gene_type:complete
MDIQQVLDPKDYQVGVIVARFQVDKLHDQQRKIIDFVMSHHRKVIIFLGVAKTPSTKRNPMDFATRQAMMQKYYPTAVILPLQDSRYDAKWSKILDNKISEVFSNSKPLLYGSRGSFIPHYQGRHDTTELTSDFVEISGTQIRDDVSREIIESSKFRAGVIHSVYAKYASTFPTVDVCAYNADGQILLARKPDEEQYRFIGGFVDATDVSLERAAYREFMEEVNQCNIGGLKYILSQKVDDWRYRGESDGIMTTLFLGRFGHGQVKATDDVAEVKWFEASSFTNPTFITDTIMPEHREMMAKLIQKVYEDELIPNLGGFFKYKQIPKDPDIARPSEFEIKIENY